MKRGFGRVSLGLIAAGTLAFGFLRLGEHPLIDDVYSHLFGPPAPGFVDFKTLVRRSTPNDALVCAPDICAAARIDIAPPVYPVPAQRLRAIVAQVASEDPAALPMKLNSFPDESPQDRYGARSRIMRFPDTINVQVFSQGETSATLALYSRSQIGYSDFGVNRARLERWLRRIGEVVAAGS